MSEVIARKRGRDGQLLREFTDFPTFRRELFASVDRRGPLHLHIREASAYVGTLCGKDKYTKGSVGVNLLRKNPGAFEDVPLCNECVNRMFREASVQHPDEVK